MLLTSKILGFTVPSDPKPIWLLGLLDQLGLKVKVNLPQAGDKGSTS
ncbi:MAG TPA: hypothetical protein VE944_31555 [Nostoc sp.]|nr:hypothetical protein [Nostoc sp.]